MKKLILFLIVLPISTFAHENHTLLDNSVFGSEYQDKLKQNQLKKQKQLAEKRKIFAQKEHTLSDNRTNNQECLFAFANLMQKSVKISTITKEKVLIVIEKNGNKWTKNLTHKDFRWLSYSMDFYESYCRMTEDDAYLSIIEFVNRNGENGV